MRYFILDDNGVLGAWVIETTDPIGAVKKLLGSQKIKEVTEQEYIDFLAKTEIELPVKDETTYTLDSIVKRIETLEKEVLELRECCEKETLNKDISNEVQFLKSNRLTANQIAARYNKGNDNKNGYSTTEIYKHLGGEGNPSEIKMSEYIESTF